MTSRIVLPKQVSHLSRRIAWTALIALAIASCAIEDADPTASVYQAVGEGSGSGGGGGGSGDPTAALCPPKPAGVPGTASCLVNRILFNVTLLTASGIATGDYPIGIGQENQPPPAAYRADVCERAWVDCVSGHLLPAEGMFCSSVCGGACAAPSAPSPFGMVPSTTWTIVPCGSIQCWRIRCQAYGCAAQDGCCATIPGSGSGG
jgi:hypothetical protein